MLDEPTASLSGTEVAALFGVLRRLRTQGVTMIYITHRLPEVLAICDRATVLRDGQVAAEIARPEFDEDALHLLHVRPAAEPPLPRPRAARRAAHRRSRSHGLTVAGHPGAIFGAQRRQLQRRRRRDRRPRRPPRLRAAAKSCTASTAACRRRARSASKAARSPSARPRDARRAGIALLTEDRKRDGLLFNLPVGANITIGNLADLSRSGIISGERERSAILAAMRELNVKAASPQASVAHLSGGNQQKLLFARVLMRAPKRPPPRRAHQGRRRLDPRRDLPPGHRARRTRASALVVVASELEEVIGLCDRCLVVSDGRLVDEFRRGEGGEERVLRAVSAAQAAAARGSDGSRAMRFAGRRVFVTGAATGIGRATALYLHAEGAAVFGAGLDGEAGRDLTAASGPVLHFREADLTRRRRSPRGCRRRRRRSSAASTPSSTAPASIPTGKRLEDVTDADWDRTIAVNLTAIFRVCRAALPLSARRRRRLGR